MVAARRFFAVTAVGAAALATATASYMSTARQQRTVWPSAMAPRLPFRTVMADAAPSFQPTARRRSSLNVLANAVEKVSPSVVSLRVEQKTFGFFNNLLVRHC